MKFILEELRESSVHGEPGTMGDYVRHNVDVQAFFPLCGKEVDCWLSTGTHCYNDNFRLPHETLDVDAEALSYDPNRLVALVVDWRTCPEDYNFERGEHFTYPEREWEPLPVELDTRKKMLKADGEIDAMLNAAEEWLLVTLKEQGVSNNPDDYNYDDIGLGWYQRGREE